MVLLFTPLCFPGTPDLATSGSAQVLWLGQFQAAVGHYSCCYVGKIRKQGRSRIQILLTKQHYRFPYTRGHCIVRKTGSCQPVRVDSPVRWVHEGQLQDRLTEVSSGRTGQPRVESWQGRWSGNSAAQSRGTLPDRGHLEPQSLSSHAAPSVGPSGRMETWVSSQRGSEHDVYTSSFQALSKCLPALDKDRSLETKYLVFHWEDFPHNFFLCS